MKKDKMKKILTIPKNGEPLFDTKFCYQLDGCKYIHPDMIYQEEFDGQKIYLVDFYFQEVFGYGYPRWRMEPIQETLIIGVNKNKLSIIKTPIFESIEPKKIICEETFGEEVTNTLKFMKEDWLFWVVIILAAIILLITVIFHS